MAMANSNVFSSDFKFQASLSIPFSEGYISCFEDNIAVSENPFTFLYSVNNNSHIPLPLPNPTGLAMNCDGIFAAETMVKGSRINFVARDGIWVAHVARIQHGTTSLAWNFKQDQLLCRNPYFGWTTLDSQGRFLKSFASDGGTWGIAASENLVYCGGGRGCGDNGWDSTISVWSPEGILVRSFVVPVQQILDLVICNESLVVVSNAKVVTTNFEGKNCQVISKRKGYTCAACQSSLLYIGGRSSSLDCWKTRI